MMKKIGNILFSKDDNNSAMYNLCTTETMRLGIPSLIVGWNNVKKMYPNQSIIDWKINEDTYWTFGKREKRDRYDMSMAEFNKLAIKKLTKSIKYKFVDLITCDVCEKVLLNDIINDTNKEKTILIIANIVYVYIHGEEIVYGFSLRDIEYTGKNKNIILDLIKKNKAIHIINNTPQGLIREFSTSLYILPYLYSE